MILNHELLKALIETCQWSDKVSELMGPEWDSDGRQLVDFIWGKFYDRYGMVGMELVGEYIACGRTSLYDTNDKIINVTTIPELMEVLIKYCKRDCT